MDSIKEAPECSIFKIGVSTPESFQNGQIILIDKPLWWTSFDVVRKLRNGLTRKLGVKKLKVGHAGALDPLATGLMIICTGKATKTIQQWMDTEKEYLATFELGRTTPSFDLETETDATYPIGHITPELIQEVLQTFVGEQMQIPPMFSAKNLQGKRAYEFARQGIEVEMNAHPIIIYGVELTECALPFFSVRVRCSKGTYIRSMARDLGVRLRSGACLTGLRRTVSGPMKVSEAISPEDFITMLAEMLEAN